MSTTDQQILQKYSQPVLTTLKQNDSLAPFSFKQWYSSRQGIITNEEYKQYNDYLIEWYKQKTRENTDTKSLIQLNYLTLLKQLQVFFTTDEIENWYNNVDITNEKELLLAIPYFARKLKNIAVYYLQLRETVKQTKLNYNQVGTPRGLYKQVQNLFLQNFSQSSNTQNLIPASIWQNIPELSGVKDTLTIQIEELYDSHNYFDHSPTVEISSYYNFNDIDLQNFLTSKNLELTSAEWLYKLGVYELSGIPIEFDDIVATLDTDNEDLQNLLLEPINLLAQKYIAEDKFTSKTPIISTQIDVFETFIEQGDNFLYWPTSPYKTKARKSIRYQSIPLTAVNFQTIGTAGSSIDLADTIFVETNNTLSGAWLREQIYDYQLKQMQAGFEGKTNTAFRFPFPGYGLSAEGIDWSGPNLQTDPRFLYLEQPLKEIIKDTYWSTTTDLTSIDPLYINNTTLVFNKAYPSINYTLADKIKVQKNPPEYNSPSFGVGVLNESWLYRMNNTDISIKPDNTTTILWPFEQIDPEDSFPEYYSNELTTICRSLPVSSINFSFSVAGSSIEDADKIYKIINYKNTQEQAIECCWLSGSEQLIPSSNIITVTQPSLQAIFKSGTLTKFIWNGPNNTDINTVFKSFNHEPDCQFILNSELSYLNFDKCTCKNILFTPFGHPGSKYTDNNSFTDFIVQDNVSPDFFDISVWRDEAGNGFARSNNFNWFKTNNKLGWGDGKWTNDFNEPLFLKTGKPYLYFRANTKTQDNESINLPDLVIRHNYQTYLNQYNQNFKWIRATKNNDNEWISADSSTEMVLMPGDLLLYERKDVTQYALTGSYIEKEYIQENRNSIWSNFDYLTINDNTQEAQFQQVTVTYPFQQTFISSSQAPALFLEQLVSVISWEVTHNNTNQKLTFRNTPSITFTPTLTGTYSVKVTAMSSQTLPPTISTSLLGSTGTTFYTNTGLYIFTQIPQITAISSDTAVPSLTTYTTPIPGFILNTPLQGWDYNSGIYNNNFIPQNTGARPYWGKTYTEKDIFTNFKSINTIGAPRRLVDEYNILTHPEYSNTQLTVGDYVEYVREYPINFTWTQPLNLKVEVNNKQWCDIDIQYNQTSNLTLDILKDKIIAKPTSKTSSIILQGFENNEPVKIYYNAIEPFVWSISAIPDISTTVFESVTSDVAIKALQPWANLSNQYYPTVATLPVFEGLYGFYDKGGLINPNNLGASLYYDKDFTSIISLTSKDLEQYFNNPNAKIGGRGLTKQDQNSPYEIIENNTWLKEISISQSLAGNVNKKVFKTHQKFLPYQSSHEIKQKLNIGLITPQSRQTPWGGIEDLEWTDTANKPTSFTGEFNTDLWANSQILKQTNLQLDNWVTDIFGNQYGLYKDIKNKKYNERLLTPGTLWVRDNTQFVSPGVLSLSGVFDTYTGTSIINELTGTGIYKIDMFFDTLMIQTSGAIIFEKLNYDYDINNIFSLANEANYISLAQPIETNLNREIQNIELSGYSFATPGETWFFPNKKTVIVSVISLSSKNCIPELFELDINNSKLKKVFPVTVSDTLSIQQLSSINISKVNISTLSYNDLKDEYSLSLFCTQQNNNNVLVDLTINDIRNLQLKNITVYQSLSTDVIQTPIIIDPQDLFITVNMNQFFEKQYPGPGFYELISTPFPVTLSPGGRLIATSAPSTPGNYFIEFSVTNNFGPIFYSLNITVI